MAAVPVLVTVHVHEYVDEYVVGGVAVVRTRARARARARTRSVFVADGVLIVGVGLSGLVAAALGQLSIAAWLERAGVSGVAYELADVALSDLSFQQTWETSRKQAGAAGILTNVTGGRHGVELGQGSASSQDIRGKPSVMVVSEPGNCPVACQLMQVLPGIAIARATAREASHPFTRGSFACYRPGQWTSIRGVEGESVGRLHFAGEY